MAYQTLRMRASYSVLRTWARLQYDWRTAASDISAGTHSKIPPCCIAFFVTEWSPWLHAHGENPPHPHAHELVRAGFHTIEHAKSGKAPQYVPCPDCLRDKRFVEIHLCVPECRDVPGGSFFGKEENRK